MDNTRAQIENITGAMRFERKTPVSKEQKAEYDALERGVSDAYKELSRLRLQLWHAVSHKDYHSLSLDEARRMLSDIQDRLLMLSAK